MKKMTVNTLYSGKEILGLNEVDVRHSGAKEEVIKLYEDSDCRIYESEDGRVFVSFNGTPEEFDGTVEEWLQGAYESYMESVYEDMEREC